MRYMKYVLLLTGFLPGLLSAIELKNGGFISGNISVPGERDVYTFEGTPGETVFLRVADTETTQFVDSYFEPSITVLDPRGNQLTWTFDELVAALDEIEIKQFGTYKVIIGDYSSSRQETGTYNLYYTNRSRFSDDGVLSDGTLENGGVHTGYIDLGDIDSYEFDAVPGEYFSDWLILKLTNL